MKTITCDFCQKPINDGNNSELQLRIENLHYPSLPSVLKHWDLCYDCIQQLKQNVGQLTVTVVPPIKVDHEAARKLTH